MYSLFRSQQVCITFCNSVVSTFQSIFQSTAKPGSAGVKMAGLGTSTPEEMRKVTLNRFSILLIKDCRNWPA